MTTPTYYEQIALAALENHALATHELLRDFGESLTPEALREDLWKTNKLYGLRPDLVEYAARLFEARIGVSFPGLSDL